MRNLRGLLLVGLVAVLVGLVIDWALKHRATGPLQVANGYAAKWVCSNVFVAGRSIDAAVADLPPNPATAFIEVEVDPTTSTVEARTGPVERHAIFRPGLGCTLLPPGSTESDLASPAADLGALSAARPWPTDLDPRLDPALDRAFAEPDSTSRRNTRAVVVIQDGVLIAERYAEGFNAAMALPGWSMTKSWTHALIGRAVQQGYIDPSSTLDPSPWPEGDPRRAIDLDALLRMSSGLDFNESYSDLQSTALRMLFLEVDMGAFAAAQPLAHPVDSRWYYSSGTTNLVSWQLRRVLGAGAYWSFPRDALFTPLGMASALIEPDASGVYVGSSYGWATARDWARFGQLYLQDGVWDGERLLPEGWAGRAAAPSAGSGGVYGGHWWLNAPKDPSDPASRRWPDVPADLYFASGFDGQAVVVVPSYGVVIVRLGLSQDSRAWSLPTFVADVLDRLAPQSASDTTIGE